MPPPLPSALRRRLRWLPGPLQSRTFVDARVKWVRDRGLDHAVEKEKHLQPFHGLKDLVLSSSSPSLPLATIAARRADLGLPFRAIRFIRLFPAAFFEELPPPSAAPPRPVIRPTPELLRIHDEEQRAFASCRDETAERLLRLLMLAPRRRLPLHLVDRLRWDLGLPRDYPRSLLPDYPDYFQIVPSYAGGGSGALDLELVCYIKDLAVSAMERYAMRTGGYKKGMPLSFPLQFPRGFELEKKVRKWLDEWQKLPYISPYEDGSHLAPRSDFAEKWTVGVLHEVLHLLVPKKTEKENLIVLGQHLGLPPGIRKVIAHHPGIFYVSNKLRTQTVVLREAYRRDLLVEKHPLMGLRYQYIHLMHKGKEIGGKRKGEKTKRSGPQATDDYKMEEEEEDDYEEEEEEEEEDGLSVDVDTEEEESDDEDGHSNHSVAQGNSLPQGGISQPVRSRKTMMMRSSV